MICGGRMDVGVDVLTAASPVDTYREGARRFRDGQAVVLPLRVGTDRGRVEYRVHLEARPRLLIVGAGHISRVLARMMLPLGFDVGVIDDRADYANADRFPPPMRTTVGDMEATLESLAIDANTFVVIVTRGHKHDEQALQAVVESPAGYIGMIGSRRKVKVVFDDLRRRGVEPSALDRIHAPIGLDIHAVTTDEIALSIGAQLVSVRRARRGCAVDGPIAVPGDV